MQNPFQATQNDNPFQATQIINGVIYKAFHVRTRSKRLRVYATDADVAREKVVNQIAFFGGRDKVIKVVDAPPLSQIEGTVEYVRM